MKKIFAIVLVVVMMMSMGSTAFAAEIDYVGDETKNYSDSVSVDVYAKYSADTSGVGVISVDIEHEAMRFVYVADASAGKWDPDTHTYDAQDTVTAGWVAVDGETDAGHILTVTNHSNVPVWIDVADKVDTTNYAGITMDFQNYDNDTASTWAIAELDAGVVNKYDEADNVQILASLGGTIANTETEYVDVADIIVTIYSDDPAGSTTNPANP